MVGTCMAGGVHGWRGGVHDMGVCMVWGGVMCTLKRAVCILLECVLVVFVSGQLLQTNLHYLCIRSTCIYHYNFHFFFWCSVSHWVQDAGRWFML